MAQDVLLFPPLGGILMKALSFTGVRMPLTVLGLALATIAPGLGCSQASTGQVSTGLNAIVFQKRAIWQVDPTTNQMTPVVSQGNSQVIDYNRYVPGGSLVMLSPPRPDGQLTDFTHAQFPNADFNGVDVSFDATQAVFSMKTSANDNYHIYTVQLTPSADGSYEMHQKTFGNADDVSPVYVAGGRVVFCTNQMYTSMGTRADEYEHSRVVVQLASITVEGGDADRALFSQNLSHISAPFVRFDGKVGYSRWEHLGDVNDVKVFAANIDGTQMVAVGGQHGKPSNSVINVKEYAPNQMVAIGTERDRTIHAGALMTVDARNTQDPACMDPNATAASTAGHPCLDEEHAIFTVLTPNVPTTSDPSPVGRYREPTTLPDGRIITSWSPGPVNDLNEMALTPPNFGIYVFDPKTQQNELVYNDSQYWSLGVTPVVQRTEPPVIGSLQNIVDSTVPARIGSVNVHVTSLQETVNGAEFNNVALSQALNSAVKVRVIEGFSSEAAPGVSMFGLTMHEGAAVLGETPVYTDGSWLANVPPYLPMHLQPIDKYGIAIRSQTLWIQSMPGENRRCGGCHESRTGQNLPSSGQNPTLAEQQGPDTLTEAIPNRTEYPWQMNNLGGQYIQQILDSKCVQCHNDAQDGNNPQTFYTIGYTNPVTGMTSQYKIPNFDMCGIYGGTYGNNDPVPANCNNQPITVRYDRGTYTWPVSYVSIFYPSAMQMTMGIELISGTVPPMWGVPANARGSMMIQTMNVQAGDGTTAWPVSQQPMHPEDVGVTVTPEERLALIRVMDLGGQYYSRQNTNFVALPMTQDPVAPGGN
jgi:Hydrazine synthase alpha subunit middle domain